MTVTGKKPKPRNKDFTLGRSCFAVERIRWCCTWCRCRCSGGEHWHWRCYRGRFWCWRRGCRDGCGFCISLFRIARLRLLGLSVDARSAPQWVLLAHSSDEIAQLMLDSGPSWPTLGFPAPPPQPQTLRWSSQGNVELMTQKEILNFKPAPRLEQIRDKCSKQVDDRKHRIGDVQTILRYIDTAKREHCHLRIPLLLMRARARATVRVWKKRPELQAHSRIRIRNGCGLPVATRVRS